MTPGYHIMPMAKYLADPCVVPSLNASVGLILTRESARKAWFSHPRLNPAFAQKEATKFDIGTAAHAMLLEGADIIEEIDADDFKTKDARAKRDAARLAGKVPLLKKHRAAVVAMVSAAEAFIQHSDLAEHWANSDSELTAISEERGIWLRGRFDRITKNRRVGIHYKTTEDVSPEKFSSQITRMGYDFTEAFYRRIASNIGAVGHRGIILAQSVEPPHECSLHACDPSLQEIADAQVQRAIDLWTQCVKTKSWPSYGGRIHYALPTSWQIQEHETRLLEAA